MVFDQELKTRLLPLFEKLPNLNKTQQLISILDLLDQLSYSKTTKQLIKGNVSEQYSQSNQIKKIFDFINNNYSKKISTKDIATYVGLTTNSFCKLFKKLTQKTFINYLKEYRINRAIILLESTNNNISQIAYQCGFEHLSYFSKVFQEIKGMKPIDCKKKIQKS